MEDDRRIHDIPDDYYFTDAITDKAIDMMQGAVADDVPFFLYLAHTAPHWPSHAPPEDIAKYDGTYCKGWDAIRTARHEDMQAKGLFQTNWDISPRDDQVHGWEYEKEPDWEAAKMATYAAMVTVWINPLGNGALRMGQFKLVRQHGMEWELYDMELDRTQLCNLAAGARDQVRDMAHLYDVWAQEIGVIEWEHVLPKLLKA